MYCKSLGPIYFLKNCAWCHGTCTKLGLLNWITNVNEWYEFVLNLGLLIELNYHTVQNELNWNFNSNIAYGISPIHGGGMNLTTTVMRLRWSSCVVLMTDLAAILELCSSLSCSDNVSPGFKPTWVLFAWGGICSRNTSYQRSVKEYWRSDRQNLENIHLYKTFTLKMAFVLVLYSVMYELNPSGLVFLSW